MAAHENLSNLQFNYSRNTRQPWPDEHEITAVADSGQVGRLLWNDEDGEISHLHVGEAARRRGIATSMWDTAHEEAETRGITPPVHSSSRTVEGDAWAKSTGDTLPPRK
jgi:ribosomal protein S18 acetylase RimI-like enzyme